MILSRNSAEPSPRNVRQLLFNEAPWDARSHARPTLSQFKSMKISHTTFLNYGFRGLKTVTVSVGWTSYLTEHFTILKPWILSLKLFMWQLRLWNGEKFGRETYVCHHRRGRQLGANYFVKRQIPSPSLSLCKLSASWEADIKRKKKTVYGENLKVTGERMLVDPLTIEIMGFNRRDKERQGCWVQSVTYYTVHTMFQPDYKDGSPAKSSTTARNDGLKQINLCQ